MLVLSRKKSQRILIGDGTTADAITITVVETGGRWVRIGIDAPPEYHVIREELKDRPRIARNGRTEAKDD